MRRSYMKRSYTRSSGLLCLCSSWGRTGGGYEDEESNTDSIAWLQKLVDLHSDMIDQDRWRAARWAEIRVVNRIRNAIQNVYTAHYQKTPWAIVISWSDIPSIGTWHEILATINLGLLMQRPEGSQNLLPQRLWLWPQVMRIRHLILPLLLEIILG